MTIQRGLHFVPLHSAHTDCIEMADHNDRNTESFKHAYEAEAATVDGKCNCGKVQVRLSENAWKAAPHALCRES